MKGTRSGGHVRLMNVGRGLGRDGLDYDNDFPLAFFAGMDNNTRKGRGLPRPTTMRIL